MREGSCGVKTARGVRTNLGVHGAGLARRQLRLSQQTRHVVAVVGETLEYGERLFPSVYPALTPSLVGRLTNKLPHQAGGLEWRAAARLFLLLKSPDVHPAGPRRLPSRLALAQPARCASSCAACALMSAMVWNSA